MDEEKSGQRVVPWTGSGWNGKDLPKVWSKERKERGIAVKKLLTGCPIRRVHILSKRKYVKDSCAFSALRRRQARVSSMHWQQSTISAVFAFCRSYICESLEEMVLQTSKDNHRRNCFQVIRSLRSGSPSFRHQCS